MGYNYYLIHSSHYIEIDEKQENLSAPSPILSFLHETIMSYMQELSYYLSKLVDLGITNETIKDNVILVLSGLAANYDYSEQQFMNMISVMYRDLTQAKEIYSSICYKHNLKSVFIKQLVKDPKKMTFSDMIKMGEKTFKEKFSKYTPEQMHLFEFVLSVIKNVNVCLSTLNEAGIDITKEYHFVLSELGNRDFFDEVVESTEKKIFEYVELNHLLLRKISLLYSQKFGEKNSCEVNTTTKPGKAILVAGNNCFELEMLLEAVKHTDIDVYTHGELLAAHTYPKLRSYKNLKGHYGSVEGQGVFDFSSFPGAILLTKHSFIKIDNLFSARLFTMDLVAPRGVIMVKNADFTRVIESALSAKGFNHLTEGKSIKISIAEKDVLEKIKKVCADIKAGKIKNVFFIGQKNNTTEQQEYFDKFFKLIGDDSFIFSLSYTNNGKNTYSLPDEYGYPILCRAVETAIEEFGDDVGYISLLSTKCTNNTLANLIYAKKMGVKHLYLCDCPQKFVNPSMLKTLREIFSLKEYTNPSADLGEITASE